MSHTLTEAEIIRAARLAQLEVGQLYGAEHGGDLVTVMYLGQEHNGFKAKCAKILWNEHIHYTYPETLHDLDSPPNWWVKNK